MKNTAAVLTVSDKASRGERVDTSGPALCELLKKDGWYYLFVSWDYCCRGEKSTYRVAVGRSRKITGPYLDRNGKDMATGGGTPFFGGDGVSLQAAGHCAAYSFPDGDIFICHGYSVAHDGAAMLVQRKISWTDDGWPTVEP